MVYRIIADGKRKYAEVPVRKYSTEADNFAREEIIRHLLDDEGASTPKNKFLVHSRRMIDHTQGRGGSRCGHRRPTITQCMGNQTSECAS